MRLHIFSAIEKYAKRKPLRFHMPGHKGRGKLKGIFPCSLDITELDGAGNVSAVLGAEKDIAGILGVKYVKFLTDGASAGIMSAICAVRGFGKKIIINRSAHKSVYNALEIFGIEPVIVGGIIENGLEKPVCERDVSLHLSDPDVAGVFLTYPDYYGRTFDIEKISCAVKERGKLFMVDSAHGGHYRFCAKTAYAGSYADIFVEGLHKTFYTLNQGALVGCNREDLRDRLSDAVDRLTTTSPSYVILATVEYGVKYADVYGRSIIEKLRVKLTEAKARLKRAGLTTVPSDDPFKLSVDFGGAGISPYAAEKALEKQNIFAEMNDGRYLLFMFSFATRTKELEKLVSAAEKLAADGKLKNTYRENTKGVCGERVMPYLSAVSAPAEYVLPEKAVGAVAAVNAGFFPPCFPVVTAGELITEETAASLSREGVFGLVGGKIRVVCKKGLR